jgi:hypothetical protein
MAVKRLIPAATNVASHSTDSALVATLIAINEDGWLLLRDDVGIEFACLWLETGQTLTPLLGIGDRLLALQPSGGRPGIALGRIGPYRARTLVPQLTIEAGESLRLKCGESSLEMRADGQVMVKGEDVLLRAKGTQRIRAGNVAIN